MATYQVTLKRNESVLVDAIDVKNVTKSTSDPANPPEPIIDLKVAFPTHTEGTDRSYLLLSGIVDWFTPEGFKVVLDDQDDYDYELHPSRDSRIASVQFPVICENDEDDDDDDDEPLFFPESIVCAPDSAQVTIWPTSVSPEIIALEIKAPDGMEVKHVDTTGREQVLSPQGASSS